jgi:hypothetical protein
VAAELRAAGAEYVVEHPRAIPPIIGELQTLV